MTSPAGAGWRGEALRHTGKAIAGDLPTDDTLYSATMHAARACDNDRPHPDHWWGPWWPAGDGVRHAHWCAGMTDPGHGVQHVDRVRPPVVDDWEALAEATGKNHTVRHWVPCVCGGRMQLHSLGGAPYVVQCPDCGREPVDALLGLAHVAYVRPDGTPTHGHDPLGQAVPGYDPPRWVGDHMAAPGRERWYTSRPDAGPLVSPHLAMDSEGRLTQLLPDPPGGGVTARECRYCGCTDDNACAGGCSWVADDVCSSCLRGNHAGDEVAADVANAWGMDWDPKWPGRWRRAGWQVDPDDGPATGLSDADTLAAQLAELRTAWAELTGQLRAAGLHVCGWVARRWFQ